MRAISQIELSSTVRNLTSANNVMLTRSNSDNNSVWLLYCYVDKVEAETERESGLLCTNVWKVLSNLVGAWWRCGHVAVHNRVHRETVETVEETCDWALTVTSRWLWTTSARRWCRLFPLNWWRGPSTVDRQVLRPWRPTSPTGTRSALVWRSCVTSCSQSLQQFHNLSSNQWHSALKFKATPQNFLYLCDHRGMANKTSALVYAYIIVCCRKMSSYPYIRLSKCSTTDLITF